MRTAFLVDGFNLYHSLVAAGDVLQSGRTRWLNLDALCRELLPALNRRAVLEKVYYFAAPPDHMEQSRPGSLDRHRTYLAALESRGVAIELGRFKGKPKTCRSCATPAIWFEEKETDVAIAVRMLTLLWTRSCDAVVLVSEDSDLSPALREARSRFPDRPVFCAFPFGRGSKELRLLATRCFRIRKKRYAAHQFPQIVEHPDGFRVFRPPAW